MKRIHERAMLLDMKYIRPSKRENHDGVLYIIWKDLDTLEKNITTIPNPPMDIYFEKDNYRNHTYIPAYQYLDKLNKVTVPYKDVISAIIEDSGESGKLMMKNIRETGNYKAMRNFYLYPYVFGADIDVCTQYRYKWMKKYDNDLPKPITKGFLDIEVDSRWQVGFADPTQSPIDLVTFIDATDRVCYTFALVMQEPEFKDMSLLTEDEIAYEEFKQEEFRKRNEQQKELIEHQEELKQELHEMFDETYGSFEYKFFFYNDEVKMLYHLFDLINSLKRDFVEIWNIRFDIPYIIERAKTLGIDPKDLFCHKDFPIREMYFKPDNFHYDIKNQTDFFYTTSYTNYICQMRAYASIRKGQSELRSNRLDYIGERELDDKKLDYSEDGSIKTLSYRNYKTYFIYNIKDVLLQFGIEDTTKDLEHIYSTSYQTYTNFDGIFKQTVKLRNVQYVSYLEHGYVTGENRNVNAREEQKDDDDDDGPTYEGALVGDPYLNLPVGIVLYGKRVSNIFDYGIDMDMGAFYPNSIIEFNIDQSTLYFKVILPANQFDKRGGELKCNTFTHIPLVPDETSDFEDDVAKECFDNLQTRNYMSTGYKWLNLPTVDELYYELKEIMK